MTDTNPLFKHPQAAGGRLNLSKSLRKQMPIVERFAYFDHAAVAPLPAPSAAAIADFAVEASQFGDTVWLQWSSRVEQLRSGIAELLGAAREEIALVPNTTLGIGLVAEGWRWQPGDSVVVPANEFPSNLVPWRQLARRGVDVREVTVPESGRIELEAILDAVDATTRLVSLSWVGFASGWRIDVARFCEAIHRRGALVFLDAIQGLGAFPLNVMDTGVDFLAADGHKWMLGPEGAGLLFVRADHLERLDPLMTGWHSLDERHAFDPAGTKFKGTAGRFEGGSANVVGLLGLERSVRLLLDHRAHEPASGFADAILANVAEIEEGLRSAGCEVFVPEADEHRSGILSLRWPDADLTAVRKFCLARGIATSVRAGRLRVSTHAYNNSDDTQRLLDAIRECMRDPTSHGQHG